MFKCSMLLVIVPVCLTDELGPRVLGASDTVGGRHTAHPTDHAVELGRYGRGNGKPSEFSSMHHLLTTGCSDTRPLVPPHSSEAMQYLCISAQVHPI